MKFYRFGNPEKPVFMTLPGTICHWKLGFEEYIPELTRYFHVVCVSYDGFDETEDTVYPDMPTEAGKIERYVNENFNGRVFCIYGCSLGGSYAAYLLQRRQIAIDHIILGSSDMDQASGFSARLQSRIVAGIMYGILKNGRLPGWMQRANEKKMQKHPETKEYREKFIALFTGANMSFVKKESVYNQFYSDLVTEIENGLQVLGSVIHVLYARKMGEKYLQRYRQHFPQADIRPQDMEHEEMFVCHHDLWLKEVLACCGIEQQTPA